MYDNLPNRSARRSMMRSLRLLRKKKNLPFPEKWLENVRRGIETGKEIHRRKTETVMRSIEEQLETIASLKVTHDSTPYKWSRKNPR